MELTQRDKKLLVFLSIFVIVVCIGYWGIYPIIKDMNEIKVQIDEEEITKQFNEMKIAQVPIFEKDNEDMEQSILDSREKFYPIMTSSEVDKYFTNLVLGYKLYSYDLNINMPEAESDLAPYTYSEKATMLEAEEEMIEQEEMTATEKTEAQADAALSQLGSDEEQDFSSYIEDAGTGIYAVRVTMKLGGDEADELRLINDLSKTDQKLRICNYSWSRERNVVYAEDGIDYEIEMRSVLTITFEIFMCEE